MDRQWLLAVVLALVGLGAVVVGTRQELLHVAPAYEGTVQTGWAGALNHEERLLERVATLGVVGTVATLRWKYAAALPLAVGGVELGYSLRAVLHYVRDPGLYTAVHMADGTTVRLVLGAEPFLLVAGGLLLVAASGLGWTSNPTGGLSTRRPTSSHGNRRRS